ncbi:Por secretion system C-terminal sorting domain-containing protein [Pontibacter akesuensis]|uniref:Por secretion system C-terminal sorting domain-containing protein n=2 Tax=Pontibacter akesuensis TaxID=388950 RepID=A0A1I7J6V6_9BACT|nr:Por secretion system C-terminal sorting domain-containing protein [Pontibacter akesuensis]
MLKKTFLVFMLQFGALVASAQFKVVSNSPVSSDEVESMGISWTDYDDDGDDDLFITVSYPIQGELSTRDVLFNNNGEGVFTQVTTGNLIDEEGTGRSSTWADFNNDGLIDAFIINQHEAFLFKNAGGGVFTKTMSVPTTSFSFDNLYSGGLWGDFNGDGYVDLFVTSSPHSDNARNILYLNNKDESFTKVSGDKNFSTARSGTDPSAIDYDNNGTLDLFVPNYCANNFLYSNQGDSTFISVTQSVLLQSSCSVGASWADYDNDGDFDVLIQNNVNGNNLLFANNGDGTFTEVRNAATNFGASSSAWGDFDNDGWIDLVIVGSDEEGSTRLLKNNEGKSFTDVSLEQGITNKNYSWAVAWSDYNKDGSLDFFVANAHGNGLPANDILYENKPNENGWINIKLKGTNSNRSAIGAVVKVKSGGKWQMRTVQSKTGNNSQNSLNIHFGLGSAKKIDTLQVIWPHHGTQEFINHPINKFIEVTEADFPKAPKNLTAIQAGIGEVKISWDDSSSDEIGFRVERSLANESSFKPVSVVPENDNFFTDIELQGSGTYYYRVASTKAGGFSTYSNVVSVTISKPTGIFEQDPLVSIYPNPVRDYLMIEWRSFNNEILRIVNAKGQTVYHGPFNSTGMISFKDFAPGLYIISLGNKKMKILKE